MESRPSRLFLPDQPTAAMRSRQRERYFGTNRNWNAAILTPITAIYDALPSGRSLTGGWWNSKEWENVLICATPQASAILDPLCALEATTSVLFLGLTGALSSFAIGTVVEPSAALLDGLEYTPTWEPQGLYPNAKVVTVRCLNESLARRDELGAQAQVVDMESAWVCAAAQQHRRRARVVLIVSDELHGRSFIDSDLGDIKTPISRAAADAAKYVLEARP
jgi:hypothetical protein